MLQRAAWLRAGFTLIELLVVIAIIAILVALILPANNEILNRSVPSLADRLNEAGYRSAYFGKWHLAGNGKPEWSPDVDGGFQFKTFMYNRGHWKKFDLQNGPPFVAAKSKGKSLSTTSS